MYKEIEVGDKTVPFLANGGTPYRFQQVFHKDILKAFFEQDNQADVADDIPKLAYIMAMSAAGSDMNKLNFDTFLEWVEQFEAFDLVNAGDAIYDVFLANVQNSEVESKKKAGGRPKGR